MKIIKKINIPFKRYYSTSKNKTVGVVFSGSGVYDGTEIHEAVSILIHLSRNNVEVKIYAPDENQHHVINHIDGSEMKESRNVLIESARIARGKIEPLSKLNVDEIDALVFPGGFGAAKNLCSFAFDGEKMKVNPQVEKAIRSTHDKKKHLAFCCISPVIPAKVLSPCQVTIGKDEGTSQKIQKFGSQNVTKNVEEFHYDKENRILSTPAYMLEAKPHQVYDGIGNMISKLITLI